MKTTTDIYCTDDKAEAKSWPRHLPSVRWTKQAQDQLAAGQTTCFPKKLVIGADHPVTAKLGAAAITNLGVLTALRSLDGVVDAEDKIVLPACSILAEGFDKAKEPDFIRDGARNVGFEEDFHSYDTVLLRRGVRSALTIEVSDAEIERSTLSAAFYNRVSLLPEEVRQNALIWKSIMIETQISDVLNLVPRDKSVVDPIRMSFTYHALDESRHRNYFSKVMLVRWQTTPADQRRLIAPLLAEWTGTFLRPDIEAAVSALTLVGMDPDDAAAVASESCPEAQVIASMRIAATHSLRMMKTASILDDVHARRAFEAAGLIDAT